MRGMYRSRTLRRLHVRMPGGKTVKVHTFRKPSKAICGKCGDVLKGVPNQRPYKMQTMAKTAKRPERPYGGVLCSKCMRLVMKEKAKTFMGESQ
jgi:large subunit ribosomal protein L34e